MKKLAGFLIVLAVIAGAAYLGINFALTKAARTFLPRAQSVLADKNITLSDLSFEKIKYNPPKTLQIHDVAAQLLLNKQIGNKSALPFSFAVDKLSLAFTDVKEPHAILSLDGFTINVQQAENQDISRLGEIRNAYWRQDAPVALSSPSESIQFLLTNATELFTETKVKAEIDFRGQVELKIKNRLESVRLYTINKSGYSALRVNQEDMQRVVDNAGLEIAPLEVQILCNYPTRAAKIIEITDYAKSTSKSAHAGDSSVPEDAYRHVLWSFMLTAAFDQAFAQRITDAHETIPGNTPEERKMDYHNNEVGRQFAQSDVSQKSILNHMKTDRRIIRYPDDVKKFYPNF